MSGASGGLADRSILITRTEDRAAGLARRLRALGARVDCRATVRLVAAQDAGPVERAIANLDEYGWVLFTSANGVRFFFEALDRLAPGHSPAGAQLAAVGPATAAAIEAHGGSPGVVADDPRAEGLVVALAGRIRPGERVLWVRPERAREVLAPALRELGALPDPVVFYRNIPAPEVEPIARDLIDGRYDAVVFASPSSLHHLIASGAGETGLHEALDAAQRIAIGEVTGSALERASLPPSAVAASPTDEGIIDALRRVFDP